MSRTCRRLLLGSFLALSLARATGSLRAAGDGNKAPKGNRAIRTDQHGDPLPPGAMTRLGTVRFRHGGEILALALPAGGKTVATAGADGTVRLWELGTGKELRCFIRREPIILSIAVSPDGKYLAAGNVRGDVWVWETATGKELRRFPWRRSVGRVALAFCLGGRALAIARAFDRTIHLWEVASGKELRQFQGHQNTISSLAVSPDGKTLASGSRFRGIKTSGYQNGTIRLWDLKTGKPIPRWVMRNDHSFVATLAFSPDGKLLASTSQFTVRLWNVATRKIIHQWKDSWVQSVAFSPDGKLLACGRDSIRIRAVATGKEVRRIPRSAPQVAFTADGQGLVSADGCSLRLWRVTSGKEIQPRSGHIAPLRGVAYAPNGKCLATGGLDRTVRLWEADTGKVLRQLDGHEEAVQALIFGPEGKTLVSASRAGETRLWELATGQPLRKFGKNRVYDYSISAFSPRGTIVALWTEGENLDLWQVRTGQKLKQLEVKQGTQDGLLAFSSDGKFLVTADERKLLLWNVATGTVARRFRSQAGWIPTSALAISLDIQTLALANHSDVYLWDVLTSRELPGLTARQDEITALAFSPDGKSLVCGDWEGYLRVWETATGKERCQFSGHQGAVRCFAFAPDGRTLASASDDSTVLLWDLLSGGRQGAQPQHDLNAQQWETLWADLARPDAARAYQAMCTLSGARRLAAFFNNRLRPVPRADAWLDQLVADLGHNRYAVRRKATRELARLGYRAEAALHKVLESRPSLEVYQRVERLLGKLQWRSPVGEQIRLLRAVEVLERLGTPRPKRYCRPCPRGPQRPG